MITGYKTIEVSKMLSNERKKKKTKHMVQVGNDQEKAQAEKSSPSKNRGGKKLK